MATPWLSLLLLLSVFSEAATEAAPPPTFFTVGKRLNLADARAECERHDATLPEPRTRHVQSALSSFQTSTGISFAWVNLYYLRGRDFYWLSNSDVLKYPGTAFSGWGLVYSSTDQEPNMMKSDRGVVSDAANNKWRTRHEGGTYPVVCQRGAAPPPSTFFTVGKRLNLADAKAECERHDATLPEPRTRHVQSALSSFQSSTGISFAWVNLYYLRGRDFYWLSNTDVLKYPGTAFSGWGLVYSSTDQEPNMMTSDRGVVSDAANNKWRTRHEAGTYPVICQRGVA